MLDKNTILNADDLPGEVVNVPEWGGSIKVRSMTAKEREDFSAGLRDKDGNVVTASWKARLVALTVVDENGARIFADADADALAGKSALVIERLSEVALRLNGLGTEQAAIAKNLPGAPNAASSSGSP
jgi:hypothetical protein